MEEIQKIKNGLTKIIVDAYEPESNRFNRNYSERAEWYFITRIDPELKLINSTRTK